MMISAIQLISKREGAKYEKGKNQNLSEESCPLFKMDLE